MDSSIKQLCDTLEALGVHESKKFLSKLDIEHDLNDVQKIAMLAPGERKQLGALLYLAGRITSPELEGALAAQERSGKKLGEVLIERNLINKSELEVLLAFQKDHSPEAESVKKLRLGNLLIATGEITRDQLNQALDWQLKYGGKLGLALISTGHANKLQINKGLDLQHKLLVGLLLIAMAITSPFAIHHAYAGVKDSAIQVSAMVAPSARMLTKYQAEQINITAKDIAQGYVDIKDASIFTVSKVRGTTYFVDVNPRSDIFKSVKIDGFGTQVILNADGGVITQSGKDLANTINSLNYRFILKPDLQPGIYAWPLQLTIRV